MAVADDSKPMAYTCQRFLQHHGRNVGGIGHAASAALLASRGSFDAAACRAIVLQITYLTRKRSVAERCRSTRDLQLLVSEASSEYDRTERVGWGAPAARASSSLTFWSELLSGTAAMGSDVYSRWCDAILVEKLLHERYSGLPFDKVARIQDPAARESPPCVCVKRANG